MTTPSEDHSGADLVAELRKRAKPFQEWLGQYGPAGLMFRAAEVIEAQAQEIDRLKRHVVTVDWGD